MMSLRPIREIQEGSCFNRRKSIGFVRKIDLFSNNKIMLNPKAKGRLKEVRPDGNYTIKCVILELELDNKQERSLCLTSGQ